MLLLIRPNPASVGSVYAHLHEHPGTGLARNLYWSVTLPCLPIEFDEEEWRCSVTCEWIVWPVRDWRSLHGVSLSTAQNPTQIECSLYFGEHHPVHVEKLELRRTSVDSRFMVNIAGTFSLAGYGDLDGKGIRFSLHSEVELEGLVVVPGSLFPKPQTEAEVLEALRPYIELENFGLPVFDRFRYVLPPALGA